jgi:hypothetical protein
MPGSIEDYFRDLLEQVAASAIVRASDLNFDKRSSMVGFVRGEIFFVNDSILHIRELVDLRKTPVRVMYVYHYQSESGGLVFRYDNTPHYLDLPSSPPHKHTVDGAQTIFGEPPDIEAIFAEIAALIE